MEKLFKLNYLYIIDSLPDCIQTGDILYTALNDNLSRGNYSGIKGIRRIPVNNLLEWDNVISDIKMEILYNYIFPFIHIEMHSDGVSGLFLRSGEQISWSRLFAQLQELNYNAHNYLFLTLGVCHGLNILFCLRISDRSPFLGAVGSFMPLVNVDLLKRFAEFYDEVLSSADVEKAYLRLKNVPATMDSDYRYIDTVELFRKVYMNYFRENCSKEGIMRRIAQTFPSFLRINHILFPTRGIRRYFKHRFIKLLQKTKDREYRRAYKRFLMVDTFPENEDRFKMPKTVYDFRHKRIDY